MPYGFIEIPKEKTLSNEIKDLKSTTSLKDKLSSAYNKASESVKNAVKNPTETLKKLGTYINAKNIKKIGSVISNTVSITSTKFSGIALAQLFVNGKITSKDALDYLFLGFAPALNQTGIAMGYSSLNELKNAMTNGTLNVAEFVSGFSNAVKSVYEFAKNNNLRKNQENKNYIYFDMTLSDSSNYQSETPDRRVEKGNDLSEFVHNLPETFDIQAELQDGKRYSKAEFRGIFEQLREDKKPVILYLGDEHFEDVILQNFNPSGQGSLKGGFEYTLQFKKINKGSVEEVEIIAFANAPVLANDSNTISKGTRAIGSTTSATKGGIQTPSGQNGRDEKTKQQQPKNGFSISKGYYTGKIKGFALMNPNWEMGK